MAQVIDREGFPMIFWAYIICFFKSQDKPNPQNSFGNLNLWVHIYNKSSLFEIMTIYQKNACLSTMPDLSEVMPLNQTQFMG